MEDKDYLRLKAFAVQAARREFPAYMKLCDPTYKLGAMHELIGQWLGRVESGEVKRLMIETPPRFGKSREAAIEWPSFMMGRHPEHRFIVATHTGSLAQDHSIQTRDRLRHPLYRDMFPETEIRDDAAGAKHWKTTRGGEYHTAGVTVKLGGFGAHTLLLDDMYADYAAARSETINEAIWNWFQSTAKTRLLPGGSIVIISTRWSTNDLMSRLRNTRTRGEELKWHIVTLPESAEENDPLGRKIGETLCPELWSDEEMRNLEYETEASIWSALYQCRPTIIGGNYLKTQNFEIVEPENVPQGQRWMRYWDLAYTTKETADYTVGMKGCLTADGTLYLADMIRGRWTFPEAKEKIALHADLEGIPLGVESGGPQVAMAQELRNLIGNTVI